MSRGRSAADAIARGLNFFYWRRLPVLTLFFVLCSSALAYYEARPVIRMSDVLTSQQAQSVYHRVEDIELDGKFYNFRVQSDMGQYNIRSLALFRKRIQEISTLSQAMNQFQKENQDLSEEIRGQFSIRANSAMDILSRPVESATSLAGQFANNLNETLVGPVPGKHATSVNYLVQESADPVAAMHKRNIASQWGLDVYSSNLNVQQFLDTVTRARSAGRISAGTPTLRSQINRPARAADSEIEANTAYLLKSKGVDELRQVNRELLVDMKINPELIERFLNHGAFSPRHITRITHYLASLQGVRNRSAFIESAVAAQDEVMAQVFDDSAMMLKHYHDAITPLEKLFAGSEVLEAVGRDRRIAYFVPIDLVYWTEETERLFDSLQRRARESGFLTWELVTAGSLTEEAGRQLELKNFVIRQNFVNR